MAEVRIASAFIIAFVLQTLFYGVFLTVFISSTFSQVQRMRQRLQVNKILFTASVYFFVGSTAYWILDFYRASQAVLSTPGGLMIDLYYSNIASPSSVARIALYESQIFVGDFIMVYRLYHVYRGNRMICIPPLMSCCALVLAGSVLAWKAARLTAGGIFVLTEWSTVCYSLTLFNNLYCFSLIVWRLLSSQRHVTRLTPSPVVRAMRIFIESAALWALFVIMTFVASLVKSNLEYTFSDMTVPIIGISFCLIIVRLSADAETTSGNVSKSGNGPSGSFPLRHIAVSVDHHMDVERGSMGDRDTVGDRDTMGDRDMKSESFP